MEGHAVYIESGFHELQDEEHAAIHGRSWRPDDQLTKDKTLGIRK